MNDVLKIDVGADIGQVQTEKEQLNGVSDDTLFNDEQLQKFPLIYAFYHLHCRDYLVGLNVTEVLACQNILQKLTQNMSEVREKGENLRELIANQFPNGKIKYQEQLTPWVLSQTFVAGVKVTISFYDDIEKDLMLLDKIINLLNHTPFSEIVVSNVQIQVCSLYQDSFAFEMVDDNQIVAFFYDIDGYNFWLNYWLLDLQKQLKDHWEMHKPIVVAHEQVERPSRQDKALNVGAFVGGEGFHIANKTALQFTNKPDFEYQKKESEIDEGFSWVLDWQNWDFATFIYGRYSESMPTKQATPSPSQETLAEKEQAFEPNVQVVKAKPVIEMN